VNVNGDIDVVDGLDFNGGAFNGTARVSGGALHWVSSHSLEASNVIILSGFGSLRVEKGTTLTVPIGATIRGGSSDNAIAATGAGAGLSTLVNRGLISADDPTHSLTIVLDRLTNNGTLQANGGNL